MDLGKKMIFFLLFRTHIRAFTFGIANAICKRILALMHQITTALGIVKVTIAKIFEIVLQCNSKGRIAL